MLSILPVIHYATHSLAISNAEMAFNHGCPGVFLISMDGQNEALPAIALHLKNQWPEKLIGINYLGDEPEYALEQNLDWGLDATWSDAPGVTSWLIHRKAKEVGERLKAAPNHLFFGSVAFKYQAQESNPGQAAQNAFKLGMLPTTSGEATGKAPAVEKLQRMRVAIGPKAPLALASGVTPDNVLELGPYLTHVLVATGISKSFHVFDEEKLALLVENARHIEKDPLSSGS